MLFRLIDKYFPPYARRLMLLSLLWNCCVYYGSRVLTAGRAHRDLTTAFDVAVPLIPWTVSVYFLAFVFWAVNFCLAGSGGEERCFRFFLTDYLARGISFVIFLVFPTGMARIPVNEGGFWNSCMRLLYMLDEPNVLFPSFHCLNSVMALLALRGEKRVGKRYTVLSFFIALSIFVSTLTTHQHVLADVLCGIVVPLLAYGLSGLKKLFPRYYALCDTVRR